MGHSSEGMTDLYDRSFEDVSFRRDVARESGTGFKVPETLNAKQAEPRASHQPEQENRALTDVTADAVGALSI